MLSEKHASSQRLFDAGLRYVAIRRRSEKEIAEYLKKKSTGVSGDCDIIPTVLEKLRKYGYVDDHAFASWVVSSRRSHHPHGTNRIIRELQSKGVSGDIISDVLQEKENETKSDIVLAREAAQKVMARYQMLPATEQKRKLCGVLLRRGFSYSISSRVVDDMLESTYNTE